MKFWLGLGLLWLCDNSVLWAAKIPLLPIPHVQVFDISSEPSGAQIFLNGEYFGFTPLRRKRPQLLISSENITIEARFNFYESGIVEGNILAPSPKLTTNAIVKQWRGSPVVEFHLPRFGGVSRTTEVAEAVGRSSALPVIVSNPATPRSASNRDPAPADEPPVADASQKIWNDHTPPQVTLLEPLLARGIRIQHNKPALVVRGTARDVNGIREVLVNGEEAALQTNNLFSIQIPLPHLGENSIKIRATDKNNNSTNLVFYVIRQNDSTNASKAASALPLPGQYRGLLIACQNYQDRSLNTLDNPIQDALRLRKTLVESCSFDSNKITLLTNATRTKILTALDDLRNTASDNDCILIFYAGHGLWDDKIQQGYWIPSESSLSRRSDWISNSDIRDSIRAFTCKHVLLITDSCFAGGILKTRDAQPDSTTRALTELFDHPSRKALTSGNLKAVPDRSVFMDYLIKYLSTNTERYLTAEKLYADTRESVMANSPNHQMPQHGVIFEAGDEGGDFLFLHYQ